MNVSGLAGMLEKTTWRLFRGGIEYLRSYSLGKFSTFFTQSIKTALIDPQQFYLQYDIGIIK